MHKLITNKQYVVRGIIIIGFIALVIPYLFALYYSMPANDDFGLGQNWWGLPLLGEAFARAGWNYMNWFGQSGIIACIIQVLFNPLYWFHDVGHSYGIFMCFTFVLIAVATLISVRRLLSVMVEVEQMVVLDLFTFGVAILLFSCFYYSDVYNWWSGVPGYSFMIMMNFFSFGNIIKYKKSNQKKDYLNMIIIGIVCCTCLMNCVATGLFYLITIFFDREYHNSFVKKIIPLIMFILSGVAMVIAPGNFARKENVGEINVVQALRVTAIRIWERIIDGLKAYPWIVLVLFFIALIGYIVCQRSNTKVQFRRITIIVVGTLISAYGAVFPYVLGEGKTELAEFTPRVYFVEDYLVFVGFAFAAFFFGQWLFNIIGYVLNTKDILKWVACAVIIFVLHYHDNAYYIGEFIPADIIAKRDAIVDTYELWDGIIAEIENSSETDVEIHREPVTWCQYVYTTGLDTGESSWGVEEYYGTCNECAARYYGKNSIKVYIE